MKTPAEVIAAGVRKRGARVRVAFEGIVVNDIPDACGAPGLRVSVKKPEMKGGSWWAVVPAVTARKVKP